MFLQEATPDTSGYMIAGYAIAFLVMALYVLSIYLRNRNLNQDLTLLEEMEKESSQAKKVAASQVQSSPAKPGRKKSGKK
jgi:cell division protein FtsL